MSRLAIVAILSLLFSGAPCLHHAYAIEQPHAAGLVPSATAMHGSAHAHDLSSASNADGVIASHPVSDHGDCCINADQAGSETNNSTMRGGASPANTECLASAQTICEERAIGVDRPPDFQSPYHQRTTCQRE